MLSWRERHRQAVAELEAAATAVVMDALGVVLDGVARHLGAVTTAAAGEPQASPDDLAAISPRWQAQVQQAVGPWYEQVFLAGGVAAEEQVAGLGVVVLDADPALMDLAAANYLAGAEQRFYRLGDDAWMAARAELLAGFREGEGIAALRRRVEEATGLARAQAEALARTEVIAASNLGADARVTLMGADAPTYKVWLATMDSRTRFTHRAADGQAVPRKDTFQVGGAALRVPGDPTGPAAEVINCRCTTVYSNSADATAVPGRQEGGVDTVAALVASAFGYADASPALGPPQIDTTTGEPHTGSMLALVPADPDALALDSGEPAEQLHVTLAYLGDAADIPPEAVAALDDALAGLTGDLGPADGTVFGAAAWNTGTGGQPCLVLSVGGADVDAAHGLAWAAVWQAAGGWQPPEQHQPWAAHLCLAYTPDPAALVPQALDRQGPIVFDRLRFTLGANAYDYPLTGAPASGTPEDPTMANNQPIIINIGGASLAAGTAVGEGVVDALRRRPQYATGGHGPRPQVVVVDALTAAAAPSGAPVTGVGEETPTSYSGPPVQPGEHVWALMHTEGESTGFRTYTNLTTRATPFAFHWQRESAAHGSVPMAVQVGNVVRVERVGSQLWGFVTLDLGSYDGAEYARRAVGGFDRWVSIGLDETPTTTTVVWPEEEDDPENPLYLPGAPMPTEEVMVEPEQVIIDGGRVGELTAVSVPAQADAVSGPTQELIDLMPGATTTVPVLAASAAKLPAQPRAACDCGGTCGHCGPPTAADLVEAITAASHSIAIPDLPPAEWYSEPDDVPLAGAFNITDAGRIYGLLAPLGTSHRAWAANGSRMEAPFGNVDYSRFMGSWALTASGQVPAGPITMDCGHAGRLRANHDVAPAHYDNACSIIGACAVGESRRLGGVWMAGALLPGVSPEQVARALACRASGDWQPHPDRKGWTELVACLLVPSPAFGSAHPDRPTTTYGNDGVLVASAVPVRHVAHPGVARHPLADAVAHAVDSAGRSPLARVRGALGLR